MNPIGNLKGFIIDVMWNILMVFGMGYMGGSIVALSQLDKAKLDEMFPIDLTQSPYVGEKPTITLTGYTFPYSLYTTGETNFFIKVINWLILTCAFVFIGIRTLFRSFSSVKPDKWYYQWAYDLFLFYVAPFLLVSIVVYSRTLTSTFITLIALFSIFVGEFILHEKKLKNGWWYALAPLSYWFTVFFAKSEPGLMNLMIKVFLGFIAFFVGVFAMTVIYPLWWSSIVPFALFYFTIMLCFSPMWYGFDKVVKEMGNHRVTLLCVFMLLSIYTSQLYLVPLATSGVIAGSIYMLYLLFKNRGKK